MPLEARISPLPARGGEDLVRRLFEPLGWTVRVEPVLGPDGEASPRYLALTLSGTARLSALLNHIYVLVPVLDDDKHYWVGEDEVAKLLARGEGWLGDHPAQELIVRRYLGHRRSLARQALARLVPEEAASQATGPERAASREEALESPIRLHDQRLATVAAALQASGARVVADLGCGEGKLLSLLARERWVERLIGVDASTRDLERAQRRLKLDQPGGPPEGRITLLHGALTYRDRRWAEADAAALVEVIEHLDPDRLPALTRIVFGEARPRLVVVTTPNADYNVLFPTLGAGSFRRADHRFEVEPRRVPRLGRHRRRRPWLCRGVRRYRPRRCRARRAEPDGRVHPMKAARSLPHRHPRLRPGGADRRHRVRQVELRRAALPADRDHLVGPLPRPGVG